MGGKTTESLQDVVGDLQLAPANVVNAAGLTRKRKRDYSSRGGGLDIEGREDIKTLKGHAKLNKIVQLDGQMPKSRSQLTESSRNYAIRNLDPIVNCFLDHFNTDAVAFLECSGQNFAHSTFITKLCDGKLTCKLKPDITLQQE